MQDTINDLFAKYEVPLEFDLLSINIDYEDLFLWKAIDPKYRPRVVIIEVGCLHWTSSHCRCPQRDAAIFSCCRPQQGCPQCPCLPLLPPSAARSTTAASRLI